MTTPADKNQITISFRTWLGETGTGTTIYLTFFHFCFIAPPGEMFVITYLASAGGLNECYFDIK